MLNLSVLWLSGGLALAPQVAGPVPGPAVPAAGPDTVRPVVRRPPLPRQGGGLSWRLDTYVHDLRPAGRRIVAVAPTVWWNDVSPLTVGLRARSAGPGRSDRWSMWFNRGVHDALPRDVLDGSETATLGGTVDFRLRWEDPGWLSAGANRSWRLDGWAQEGTVGASIGTTVRGRASTGAWTGGSGLALRWLATREANFLDARRWANAGTVEFGAYRMWERRSEGGGGETLRVDGDAGWLYRLNRDPFVAGRYASSAFGRLQATAVARRVVFGFHVGLRLYGGAYLSPDPPLPQRGIQVQGADPYQTLGNPFLRTIGAPLAGRDVPYHAPGHLNLRGYGPGLAGRWGVAANFEVSRSILRGGGLLRDLALVSFLDAAAVDTAAVISFSGAAYKPLYDAGAGVRVALTVGDLTFPVRLEFPFYVSSPLFAHDRRLGDAAVEFRWLLSLQPSF